MAINNSKIAKNTLLLYVRMLLIMGVSLYTSRIILDVLGVEDYGLYNLIAGCVTLFAFISNAMVLAMQRFFNIALGHQDYEGYSKIYSMSINMLLVFCLIVLLIGETVGVWFISSHLNIPVGRETAAQVVFQLSLFTFIANSFRTPFHASIISHERMQFYAAISIVEVLLRLLLVFALRLFVFDHLILYAILYLLLISMVGFAYYLYCRYSFTECRYKFERNRQLLKDIFGFSGWSLLGQSAVVCKNQGEAILINRFFSVSANAAMGVASQVTGAIEMFVSNFQTAFNPQLTQTYTNQDKSDHYSLILKSSKFSYYLLLILLLPVVFNIDFILSIWLKTVPAQTNYFVVYILISYMLNALSSPFATSIFATGEVKYYQLSVFAIFLLGLFFSFVVLELGFPAYCVSIVAVGLQAALFAARVVFCMAQTGFPLVRYFKHVVLRLLPVTAIAIVLPWLLSTMELDGFLWRLVCAVIDVAYACAIVVWIGLSKEEKVYVGNIIKSKIKK